MKLLLTTIFILTFSICAYSQTERDELQVAQSRLVKTLDALEKAEALIDSLKRENAALTQLNVLNEQIIDAQKEQIKAAKSEIEVLKKKSQRKLSFFFGLVTLRY